MAKVGFNFAVIDADGRVRSDIWKVRVSKKSDVMIGNSSMGSYKYTLHAPRDGQFGCHLAWTSTDAIPASFPPNRRAFQRWERRETAPGTASAVFSVNFPASFLAEPYQTGQSVDLPIPVPGLGMVAEVIFIYSRERLARANWPAGSALVADIELSSGEFVHVLRWERPMPDEFAFRRVEELYPERGLDAFPPETEARLTISIEPDENGCVKAIEVGGAAFRRMLLERWAIDPDALK